MKILFLNNDFPLPVIGGNRMRTWNFIEVLSKKHELSLLCFKHNDIINSPDLGNEYLNQLSTYFKNIWLVDKKNVCSRIVFKKEYFSLKIY